MLQGLAYSARDLAHFASDKGASGGHNEVCGLSSEMSSGCAINALYCARFAWPVRYLIASKCPGSSGHGFRNTTLHPRPRCIMRIFPSSLTKTRRTFSLRHSSLLFGGASVKCVRILLLV